MTPLECAEAFREAEVNLWLEGLDPRGQEPYESVKARVIAGDITAAEGKAELIQYHGLKDIV